MRHRFKSELDNEELPFVPDCQNCGEKVHAKAHNGILFAWVHFNTSVSCCGDPDTGDYRQATPGPSRIYGHNPELDV